MTKPILLLEQDKPVSQGMKLIFCLILATFIWQMFSPKLVSAQELEEKIPAKQPVLITDHVLVSTEPLDKLSLLYLEKKDDPKKYYAKLPEVRSVMTVVATAYNSEPRQTDSTPCITANGFNVCQHKIEDTLAANFLRFGTKVKIPEIFGDRIFVVRDRMNPRYAYRIDVWMNNRNDAITFGKRLVKIQIVD